MFSVMLIFHVILVYNDLPGYILPESPVEGRGALWAQKVIIADKRTYKQTNGQTTGLRELDINGYYFIKCHYTYAIRFW